MFEGETFFKSILYKTLVSQTLEATDEVVSIFGCQVMRVALDKNEPWSSFPALVTPTS